MKGKPTENIFQDIPMDLDAKELSAVQRFYYGKSIFITGVTGFIGKMVVEKLLRFCPGIGNIYMLMREKRGKTGEERIEALLKSELFDKLRKQDPDFKRKLFLVYGDLEKPGLGISEDDAELLKSSVEIVFHAAARVKWDDPLKVAALHHIEGTKSVIELIKKFKKLESFVYVSTSYVYRDPDLTVPEYVPKTCMTPTQFMDTMNWMSDEAIEAVAPHVMGEKTNTYLFTKWLAENVVVENRENIPTAIVRPCNISPSVKEPFPGWCDTVQGIQGLMLAAAKGFLRTLYSYRDLKLMIVPADIVVNTMVAAAWHIVAHKQEDILVINSVLDYDQLPLANDLLLKEALTKRDKYPLLNMYRYPDFTLYFSPWPYYIHATFDHYIPALIGDTFLYIFTGKTLMVRLYKKINFLFGVFTTVGDRPWICKMENYNMVKNHLDEKDAEMFDLDTDNMNWPQYIDDVMYAGRKLLAKEDPSNIPYAKKKAKVWFYVTTILKWCIILYLLYCLVCRFSSFSFEFDCFDILPLDVQSHAQKMT